MSMPPDPPELKEARSLWLANHFPEALAKFDAMLAMQPDHPNALLDAARAFGAAYQIGKAERLLDHYLAIMPENAASLIFAGQSYRMISRGVKARECLMRARAFGSLDPVAALELALLCDRSGDRKLAMEVLDEVLVKLPDFSEGQFFRAQVLIRQGAGEQAIPILENLVNDDRQHVYLRTRAAYALAEAADRAGDGEEAFRQARRAKEFGRHEESQLRTISTLLKKQADQLLKASSLSLFDQWKREDALLAQRIDPSLVLLTGSPRSGTTLLEKVLDAHPRVVSSDEHDLFARMIAPPMLHSGPGKDAGKNLIARNARFAHKQRQDYFDGMEELIGESMGERVFLDKNPSLTELLPAWLRMAPRSKVLIMLRDPRDVVVSCFLNYFPLNAFTVDFLSLEQTARRYVREMGYWLKIRSMLPKEQWKEVRYEDCVRDLSATAREVVEWLGLEWTEETLEYRTALRRRLTNSPTYSDVQQPIYERAVGRWRRYENEMKAVLPILEPFVREFGYV